MVKGTKYMVLKEFNPDTFKANAEHLAASGYEPLCPVSVVEDEMTTENGYVVREYYIQIFKLKENSQ
jgi:hypothetical protein